MPMVRAIRPAPRPASKLPTRGPVWPKAGVVGGNRQVADEVQHMATADGVAGDHRHHRLRAAANLHLQIEHIEVRHAASSW
jgi:hypothetical protein